MDMMKVGKIQRFPGIKEMKTIAIQKNKFETRKFFFTEEMLVNNVVVVERFDDFGSIVSPYRYQIWYIQTDKCPISISIEETDCPSPYAIKKMYRLFKESANVNSFIKSIMSISTSYISEPIMEKSNDPDDYSYEQELMADILSTLIELKEFSA